METGLRTGTPEGRQVRSPSVKRLNALYAPVGAITANSLYASLHTSQPIYFCGSRFQHPSHSTTSCLERVFAQKLFITRCTRISMILPAVALFGGRDRVCWSYITLAEGDIKTIRRMSSQDIAYSMIYHSNG